MKHVIERIIADKKILIQARQIYDYNEKPLEQYIDFLFEWNQKINLVSRNVSRETIREHIIHSLLPMPLKLLDSHSDWIDSGTGGGLPGIPLAICNMDKNWALNDNIRKKMRAVDDIILRLDLMNCRTIAKSISLVRIGQHTGIATKHAFKIPDLFRLLGKSPWKTILMWKGTEDAEKEIHECKQQFHFKMYEFDFGKEEAFYEGKGLVHIERNPPDPL